MVSRIKMIGVALHVIITKWAFYSYVICWNLRKAVKFDKTSVHSPIFWVRFQTRKVVSSWDLYHWNQCEKSFQILSIVIYISFSPKMKKKALEFGRYFLGTYWFITAVVSRMKMIAAALHVISMKCAFYWEVIFWSLRKACKW